MTAAPLAGLTTGSSHAPDTAGLVTGAAPDAWAPPVDNPPPAFEILDRGRFAQQ